MNLRSSEIFDLFKYTYYADLSLVSNKNTRVLVPYITRAFRFVSKERHNSSSAEHGIGGVFGFVGARP